MSSWEPERDSNVMILQLRSFFETIDSYKGNSYETQNSMYVECKRIVKIFEKI